MKTKIISKLKKELLLVEFPENKSTFDDLTFLNSEIEGYNILGSPDEIKEEDADELVDYLERIKRFKDYKSKCEWSTNVYTFKTALESFHSALESEIYWNVNPLKYWFENADKIDDENEAIAKKQFDEAQEKTFDKKRTLIFVKN